MHQDNFVSDSNGVIKKLEQLEGIPDFTTPYRRWLEGMRMLEAIVTRTTMVMDVDQVGDLRGGTLISLSIHGDFWRQNKRIYNFE